MKPNTYHRTLRLALIVSFMLVMIMPRQASAYTQDVYAVELSLTVHNRSLKDVLALIEEKTEFTFTYDARVDVARLITLDGQQRNLGRIMEDIAHRAHLEFRQMGSILVLRHLEVKSAGPGIIKGRAMDESTNEVLPGSTVLIKGTTNGTTTDLNGEFTLRTLPGNVEIEISYIGFKKMSQSVTVQSGAVTEMVFRMAPDVTQLAGIVVTGIQQGQQRALNQQRSADNIKNVVSADQIGRFPDPNVAEALQRVPAVNVERDQGEGRYVLVRGLAPQFTNISINGEQIPSPEAGVRYVALDAVPADQLSSIEVSKAITPDMDGDAIGGSVNLITRTATQPELGVKATGVAGYNNISNRSNLQGSLELSKRIANDKLGIMLNSSYYETDRGSDNWERDDDDLELRDYELLRTRLGLSSTIDYKFNDQNEVYFRTIYNRFTDREHRRRYVFVPNVDNSPAEQNEIERLTKDRLEKQIVTSYNLGARHTFPAFSLDYEASYSEAIQDTPFDIEVGSVGEVDQLSIDFDSHPQFPSFSVNDVPHTNPENIYLNNTLYEFNDVLMGNTYAKDVNKTAKFNVTIPYRLGKYEGSFKFGSKVRLKEKSYDITENVFEYTQGDFTLDQYAGGLVDKNFLNGRYRLSANADAEKFISFFNANRNLFQLQVDDKLAAEAVESYTAEENVYAGYAMGKLQLSQLMFLGGVRYERTTVNYSFSEVRYGYDGELEEITPRSGATDYAYFLPQVHAKYSFNENTNLRAAVTRSYARPNFQDIIPAQEIELSSREGTIGNPDLTPVSATNIDVLAERYFGSTGILSGGVFYKQLQNFIFNKRFENDTHPGAEGVALDLVQAQNGEQATLFGFEFAYRQPLTFLPGFLKGFNLYANYTFTTSNAVIQNREDNALTEEIRLPGQARHVGNVALGYDLGRFNIRVSSNFNGEYVSEVGEEKSEDLYVKDRMQLDATATVTITPKLRFFTEFLNITNQPFEVYQGSKEHYIQREYYSWWTRIGLKFDF